jgi:hypothetical protein
MPLIAKKMLGEKFNCKFNFSIKTILIFLCSMFAGLSVSHISRIKKWNIRQYQKQRDTLNNILLIYIPIVYLLKVLINGERIENIDICDLLLFNVGFFMGVLFGYILFRYFYNKFRPSVYFYRNRHTANIVIVLVILFMISKLYLEKLNNLSKYKNVR